MAELLRKWLRSVIQAIEPFVSSEDISKGARWTLKIQENLKNAVFGIICVTAENMNEPWLNFEAGALSNVFGEGRVCPLLFDVTESDVDGPLAQFQMASIKRDDMLRLVETMNKCAPSSLPDEVLQGAFERCWPEFEQDIAKLKVPGARAKSKASKTGRDTTEILDEVLELVRSQSRLLRDPETLLPPQYVNFVLRQRGGFNPRHPAFRDALQYAYRIRELLASKSRLKVSEITEVRDLVDRMMRPLQFLEREDRYMVPMLRRRRLEETESPLQLDKVVVSEITKG